MPLSSILVVDDEPNNFDVIEAFLSEQDYQVYYAASGQEALASLDTFQPDLILLDVMMPDLDGIEVCQRIKAMPKWQAIPIIMVTALATRENLAQCLRAGADDFIGKPVNRLELTARVRSMLRIRQQYQQLATFNAQLEQTVQQRTAELQALVFQDTLTQLPSRTRLLKELSELLQAGIFSFAVVTLDCDQFKLVNGSFGHRVGNQLLISIAERLRHYRRPDDVLARMGGDEFCFLLYAIDDMAMIKSFINGVLQSFETPFSVENCDIFMSVCIGVALGNDAHQNAEEPLQDADTAMYQAKLKGKNSYQIFDRQMHVEMLNRLILESELQHALDNQEFVPYYQPIVNLKNQSLVGFEALVRWRHPEREIVAPDEFIPSMETTGLIIPVGMLVLRQACQQLSYWQQLKQQNLTMSVNLSVRQFASPTLLSDIDQVLQETGIFPGCLKLEITESVIIENRQLAVEVIKELRSRNIQISIDDFGTGYSSLGYLYSFPVDNLKIDRSFVNLKIDRAFVNQIQSEERKSYVVDTIVALSKHLGLSVTAEGIETPEQLNWLTYLGCEFGQGYLFAQPLSATEIERTYFAQNDDTTD